MRFAETAPVRTLRLRWAGVRPRLRARLRTEARAAVRATRELTPTGSVLRAGFRVLADPARAVGLLRRRWSRRTLRTLAVSGYDHLRAAPSSAPLRLGSLRVGRGLDVSLRLHGEPEDLVGLTGLALQGRRGAPLVPVESVVQRDAGTAWVSAVLPRASFPAAATPSRGAAPAVPEPGRLRLQLLGQDGPVPVAVPSRRRLRHRWSRRSFRAWGWPARVLLDHRGRLVVAAAPPPLPLSFRVLSEPDAFSLLWRDATTRLSLARFTHRRTGAVVSTAGELDEQGQHRVRLDLDPLVDPADDWDLEVLTAAGGPQPLQSMPGDYPPLRGAPRYADAHAATPRSGAVTASLLYTATNRLAVRVRPTPAAVL